MIAPAHPDDCCCEVCDGVFQATADMECVNNGCPLCRIEQELNAQEPQPRGWRALALDVALNLLVLCGAVGVVWLILFLCGVR